jgi:hypothetical protein
MDVDMVALLEETCEKLRRVYVDHENSDDETFDKDWLLRWGRPRKGLLVCELDVVQSFEHTRIGNLRIQSRKFLFFTFATIAMDLLRYLTFSSRFALLIYTVSLSYVKMMMVQASKLDAQGPTFPAPLSGNRLGMFDAVIQRFPDSFRDLKEPSDPRSEAPKSPRQLTRSYFENQAPKSPRQLTRSYFENPRVLYPVLPPMEEVFGKDVLLSWLRDNQDRVQAYFHESEEVYPFQAIEILARWYGAARMAFTVAQRSGGTDRHFHDVIVEYSEDIQMLHITSSTSRKSNSPFHLNAILQGLNHFSLPLKFVRADEYYFEKCPDDLVLDQFLLDATLPPVYLAEYQVLTNVTDPSILLEFTGSVPLSFDAVSLVLRFNITPGSDLDLWNHAFASLGRIEQVYHLSMSFHENSLFPEQGFPEFLAQVHELETINMHEYPLSTVDPIARGLARNSCVTEVCVYGKQSLNKWMLVSVLEQSNSTLRLFEDKEHPDDTITMWEVKYICHMNAANKFRMARKDATKETAVEVFGNTIHNIATLYG